MPEDFFSSLAEAGVQMGLQLLGHALKPEPEIDRTKLMNAIVEVAGETAAEVVRELGIAGQIDQAKFDGVACSIGVKFKDLAECLLGTPLNVEEASTECFISWHREFNSLKPAVDHG